MFDAQSPDAGGSAVPPLLPMVGHTRDISETGLAIVVTSDSPGSQRDGLIGRELRIVLDLPAGLTHLRGAVVRAQPLPAEDRRRPYELTESGRVVLTEQLRSMQQIVTVGHRRIATA